MDVIELYHKNDRIIAYLVDSKYILKISKSTLDEQMKQDRLKSVLFVPKIHSSGSFTASGQKYYFLISDYVQGNDLFSVLQELTDEHKINIGKEIAQFLIELHSIKDSSYDIGHYIATIPRWKRSWKDGHLEYIKLLRNGLSEMSQNWKVKKQFQQHLIISMQISTAWNTKLDLGCYIMIFTLKTLLYMKVEWLE